MRDFEKRRKNVENQEGQLGKNVVKKLKNFTKGISVCYMIYLAYGEHDIRLAQTISYMTNIHAKTCTCWAWELSGLLCVHVISCLSYAYI